MSTTAESSTGGNPADSQATVLTDPALPPGYGSINPFVAVRGSGGAVAFIQFLEHVFDARETLAAHTVDADDLLIHAEARVGNSTIMICDAKPHWAFTPALLQVYVRSASSVVEHARASGATVITEPTVTRSPPPRPSSATSERPSTTSGHGTASSPHATRPPNTQHHHHRNRSSPQTGRFRHPLDADLTEVYFDKSFGAKTISYYIGDAPPRICEGGGRLRNDERSGDQPCWFGLGPDFRCQPTCLPAPPLAGISSCSIDTMPRGLPR